MIPGDRISKILRFFQVDRAVAYALAGNCATLILGPLAALLIIAKFSPTLQGFYYSFGSLMMVQYILDFGLGQAIIQFASHEWAALSMTDDGRIIGREDALSRLTSLGRIAFKWYGVSGAAVLAGLMPVGILFFSASPDSGIPWTGPWILLCLGLGLNFVVMPAFYLLQGCNQVSQFWRYRFIQQAINGLCLCAAILLGAGLWAWSIALFAGLVWSACFLLMNYPKFLLAFLSPRKGPSVAWAAELWPVQWKIAISWLSASFTTFFFTPLIFRFFGPVTAGRMGMAVSLNSVLLAVAANWSVTKAPRFGVLIARGQYDDLDKRFSRSFRTSLAVVFLGAVLILSLVLLINGLGSPFRLRILPPLPLALFLAGTIMNSMILNIAVYLRAHKQEPLSGVYLAGSLAIMASSLILAPRWGALGVTAAYFGVITAYQFPSSLRIFKLCRERWHGPTVPAFPLETEAGGDES